MGGSIISTLGRIHIGSSFNKLDSFIQNVHVVVVRIINSAKCDVKINSSKVFDG